ncbi:MAG TPA: UDP-N-acetylmuramoyl-L-alanine--D-glutamate ligase, partial [Candidatus Saccharimonadales bacterium]|nr:UDP-N-acetylmuramoyl-L-alanine--D-glutamate ligase [Candidatus Saccharimonadales bacterium]
MKIGLVGWGLETKSAFHYFGPDNDYLIVNEAPQDDFPSQSEHIAVRFLPGQRPPGLTGNVADLSYLEGIQDCDKIIYSTPAAKNLEAKFGDDKSFWSKATTIQHIFFENVKTRNIIGVTGSKGKGTTSALISEILKAAGKKVFFGGNVGLAVLDFINDVQPDDWVVLELSNFQLYNLTYSPHIAVCLMLVPEHLEWHPDMEDYVEAKANLFRHQKPEDIAVYFENNGHSKHIAGYSPGKKIPYFYKPGAFVRADRKIVIGPEETEVIGLSDIKLLGKHNLENICAAVTAAWEVTQDIDAYRRVLSTFGGLEHRLEFVRELEGVKYYDDSFGTTPDTAIVALRAIIEPVVLIVGGHDKRLDNSELIKEIAGKDKVRHVVTIGQIGPELAKMLRDKGYDSITEGLNSMAVIVGAARAHAQPGDAVLLSCATSSF